MTNIHHPPNVSTGISQQGQHEAAETMLSLVPHEITQARRDYQIIPHTASEQPQEPDEASISLAGLAQYTRELQMEGKNMSESDVRMARFLLFAYSLACGVAQEVSTRTVVVLPHGGVSQVFSDVGMAGSWLREYATCGTHGRRCFSGHCSVIGSAALYGASEVSGSDGEAKGINGR